MIKSKAKDFCMKKYIILTSLLTLTACGGGGGGGSAPASLPSTIVANFNLSDADFINNYDEQIKFTLDENGQVIAITTTDENSNTVTYNHNTANKFITRNKYYYITYDSLYDKEYVIISDTKMNQNQLFNKHVELLKQNGFVISQSTLNELNTSFDYDTALINTSTIDINSMGNNSGLMYSDFGNYSEKINLIYDGAKYNDNKVYTYVGGLTDHQIEKPTNATITFTGSATLALNHFTENNNDYTIDDTMTTKTNDAKLELKDGGFEILTMNFANNTTNPWYNIVIASGLYDAAIDINDETTKKIKNSNFKLNSDLYPQISFDKQSGMAAYFGTGTTPTEAVAMIGIEAINRTEPPEKQNNSYGIKGSAAFGGKAQ